MNRVIASRALVRLSAGSKPHFRAISSLARASPVARTTLSLPRRQIVALGQPTGFSSPLSRGFSTFLDEKEVEERVLNVVKGFDKVPAEKVNPKAHFINDLGLDSLDTVEVVMAIEEEFVIEIPDDMAEKILTVEDAVKFISQHPQAK